MKQNNNLKESIRLGNENFKINISLNVKNNEVIV